MRYVAAYCLSSLSGKEPSAKDLEKILGSVGVDCDAADAKKVVGELNAKVIEEVISEGKGKVGTMPVGAGPAASGGGGGGSSAPAAAAKEEKKEEKKEESEEESDEDMGFGLFD